MKGDAVSKSTFQTEANCTDHTLSDTKEMHSKECLSKREINSDLTAVMKFPYIEPARKNLRGIEQEKLLLRRTFGSNRTRASQRQYSMP